MNTIALPKSVYSEILKRQERADVAIAKLQERVKELSQDELRPDVVARLAKQSQLMDAGKGRRFKSMKDLRAYVRTL